MSLTTGTKSDVRIPRGSSTRTTETRDHDTRKAHSTKFISDLDAPTPPPGIVYKWVRHLVGSQPDEKNIIKHEIRGWVNVKPEDIIDPDFRNLKTSSISRKENRIQFGEMVLMQNDISETESAQQEAARALQSLNESVKRPAEMQTLGDRKYIQSTPVEHKRYYE